MEEKDIERLKKETLLNHIEKLNSIPIEKMIEDPFLLVCVTASVNSLFK